MKTYCLHHLPAVDRKDYLLSHFDTSGWHWVTEYLPTDEFIAAHPRVYSRHAANGPGFVNVAELSLYYKHKLAIDTIRREQDFGFVIEDDLAAPSFDLPAALGVFVTLMKKHHADLVFVGSYGNCDIELAEPALVTGENTLSRCTHAIIYSPRRASELSDFLGEVRGPIDWQLNYAIRELGLKSCWSYPHLYQRTEKNALPSLIRQ